jgi:hypothetical protein
MFKHFSKLILSVVLLLAVFCVEINISTLIELVRSDVYNSGAIVDRLYLARQNKNIVDNFGLHTPKAEAAVSSAEREYNINIGPISGTATANYVYGTLFNPTGSGRTISIKRVMIKANAAAAVNFSNLALRRVTVASGGTQITATNIPKKNASSSDSIAEVRHTGVVVTYSGATQSRLLGAPLPNATGRQYSVREVVFDEDDEKLILQPGEGVALYQEAAGTTGLRISLEVEWEEVTSTPTALNEYMLSMQRVEVAAAIGYVYNSLFNPVGSGKTAVVKRVWFGTETCDTNAVYTNNIQLRRISAASGGTQITAANIPKKNTSSSNSVMEARYTGVTVTQVGGADARLGMVTPCGAAGEEGGWNKIEFHPDDEQLILQSGEGLAIISETAGDIDQLVRMHIEWEEVTSEVLPQNEYMWASNRVEVAAALGRTFYTIFNPASSGKSAEVKRLAIRVNADTTATYSTFNFQRISTSTTGTLISATDIPKKHTGSVNSVMQIRWCGSTCATTMIPSYVGAISTTSATLSDSGIMKALGPGTIGQLHGQFETVFTPNEPLVLKAGEGIGFYLNYLAGDVDHYVKISAEWGEVSGSPSSQNEYLVDIGAMPGVATAGYNYATFFNPSGSGKTAIIKRSALRANAIGAAAYNHIQVKRISAASGGTQITAANIPKKNTAAANSAMEIRRTGVTATYSQSADAQFMGVTAPGAAASALALGQNAWRTLNFEDDERIILQPGEGIVLNNNTAGNTNHRLYWYLEWEEIDSGSTPASEGEYLMTIGPITGSTAANYVYSSLFNPATSNKLYVVKRIGIRANRTGTLTAPGYIPITLRTTSAASGGTQVTSTNIAKKHTGTAASTAEIRKTGATVSLALSATSRLLSAIAPGAVNHSVSIIEKELVTGDELVLYPGQGIALYQESAAGDALINYYMTIEWLETDIPLPPQSLTFSISDTSVGFGTLLPGATRYATGNGLGASSDTTYAHYISVATNATDGYVMYLSGNTLTCPSCGGATINAIGGTAAAASVGTEQFGLRATASSSGATSAVSSPYNGANWALDTATFPDIFATGSGDSITTDFQIRYMSNIASNSEAGSYGANLNYIVTATF